MATVQELRASIEEKRRNLHEAIESASDRWEVASGPDEWTPRATAEHAISMEWMYAGMLAEAVQGDAPERQTLSLANAQEALSALEAAIQDCTPGLRNVTGADLSKPAEIRGEVPSPDIPKTVEGVLWLTAFHLDDHAQQIAATV